MSIASELERIRGNVKNTYSALSAKGATLPETQNTDNLEAAVQSIQSGSPDAVLFTEQTLTEAQKAQARTNIGIEELSHTVIDSGTNLNNKTLYLTKRGGSCELTFSDASVFDADIEWFVLNIPDNETIFLSESKAVAFTCTYTYTLNEQTQKEERTRLTKTEGAAFGPMWGNDDLLVVEGQWDSALSEKMSAEGVTVYCADYMAYQVVSNGGTCTVSLDAVVHCDGDALEVYSPIVWKDAKDHVHVTNCKELVWLSLDTGDTIERQGYTWLKVDTGYSGGVNLATDILFRSTSSDAAEYFTSEQLGGKRGGRDDLTWFEHSTSDTQYVIRLCKKDISSSSNGVAGAETDTDTHYIYIRTDWWVVTAAKFSSGVEVTIYNGSGSDIETGPATKSGVETFLSVDKVDTNIYAYERAQLVTRTPPVLSIIPAWLGWTNYNDGECWYIYFKSNSYPLRVPDDTDAIAITYGGEEYGMLIRDDDASEAVGAPYFHGGVAVVLGELDLDSFTAKNTTGVTLLCYMDPAALTSELEFSEIKNAGGQPLTLPDTRISMQRNGVLALHKMVPRSSYSYYPNASNDIRTYLGIDWVCFDTGTTDMPNDSEECPLWFKSRLNGGIIADSDFDHRNMSLNNYKLYLNDGDYFPTVVMGHYDPTGTLTEPERTTIFIRKDWLVAYDIRTILWSDGESVTEKGMGEPSSFTFSSSTPNEVSFGDTVEREYKRYTIEADDDGLHIPCAVTVGEDKKTVATETYVTEAIQSAISDTWEASY